MKKTLTILLGVGLLATSLNSLAFGRPSFETIDTDGDGKISYDEFMDAAPSARFSPEEIFKKLDANADGFIDQGEFTNQPKRTGGRQ